MEFDYKNLTSYLMTEIKPYIPKSINEYAVKGYIDCHYDFTGDTEIRISVDVIGTNKRQYFGTYYTLDRFNLLNDEHKYLDYVIENCLKQAVKDMISEVIVWCNNNPEESEDIFHGI